MNLDKWLDSLAAVLQHKLAPFEAKEYLDELKTWTLSDDEWLELKKRARSRFQFFPRPTELQDIVSEIKRDVRTRSSSNPDFELFTHTDGLRYARRRERIPF